MKNDYSEYLKKPGMLDFIEKSWLTEAIPIHDFHAGVINEVIKKFEIETAIEIGCGTGNIAARLEKKIDYWGIDANKECLLLAKNKTSGLKFYVADVRKLKVDKPFDLVFTFGVLKHFGLHEWSDIFTKVCSIGDILVFNMPTAEKTKDDGDEFHHVWMTMPEIYRNVKLNGFEVLEVIEHGVEPIFICKRK